MRNAIKLTRFAQYAWGVLAYNLAVILWGAYVRATGSGAALSLTFIIIESLVGAGLVLFKLVAYDDSLARVYAISAHLVNTFLMLASLALTAWWASGGKRLSVYS